MRTLPLTLLLATAVASSSCTAQGVGVVSAPPSVRTVSPPPPPPPPMMAEPMYDDYAGEPSADLSGPPTFMGTLTDQDQMRDGDTPVDTYTSQVRAGDEVTVTMNADGFDTYLIVRQPDGRELSNDDFGSTRVSQVSFNATQAGTITIQATAYSSSGRGSYEVRVSSVRATVVSTTSGRLDYQDQQQIKGEFYDTLTVRAPASGEFFVDLVSLGFPGFLRVTAPSGAQTRSEPSYSYGEEQAPIRVGPLQGERGTWTVDVTSSDASSPVGAYDVRVITMDAQ